MNIFISDFKSLDYFVATYYLASRTNVRNAAWELAIGQSVGNPNIRTKWENEQLFRNHSCIILADEEDLQKQKRGYVKIAFPFANINLIEDGISQLLCQLMGGQMDIDDVTECHLLDVDIPTVIIKKYFLGPKYGISGARKYTNVYDKPLLGGIVKPKVAPSPAVLLDIVKQMVDGGVNFIKEDEIMANPSVCSIEERLPDVAKYLDGKSVIYCACINSDPTYLLSRAIRVSEIGINGIHVNFWSGLGSYKSLRELDLPLFIHFQKSGDKILTNKMHAYHVEWNVICKLAAISGIDFTHAGMWGGYMNDSAADLHGTLGVLRSMNVMPALSCGMHAGIVNAVTEQFGNDYLANVGGAIHGHPNGTTAGARAMRQAIDGMHGPEYFAAIEKWGLMV